MQHDCSMLGKVQCEEYSVEVGSLFMHGVWDEDSSPGVCEHA